MGPKTRITFFDLDHTLLPIDSDYAWGEFTQAIGWTDPVVFKRRNDEFFEHYQAERYHQGIGGQLIQPGHGPRNDNARLGAIGCRSRLGGVLNFYHRVAA